MATRRAGAGATAGTTACGRPGDRAISGRTCTVQDDTSCAVKVGVAFAAVSAERLGMPVAGQLEALRQRLERDETVCLSAAQAPLRAWVAGTLQNPEATAREKTWARDVSEALLAR